MKGAVRTWLLLSVTLCGLAAALGFVVFANAAMRDMPAGGQLAKADGIVVLTGAPHRIEAGIALLDRGLGSRLLISGVNPMTKAQDLKRIVKSGEAHFDCCVDLGYQALTTRGNADEIGAWARRHRFKDLIVVTSNYHMARAMAEISRVMPLAELSPYAVVPQSFKDTSWWLNPEAAVVLLKEYVKFLPAAAELAAFQLFGFWTAPSVADNEGGAARRKTANGM